MKYHEKPAHFRELFSNLLPILLALFIWTNPVLAQNNGELITLSLKNKTIGEALETINKRYNYTFVLRTPDIDTKRKVSFFLLSFLHYKVTVLFGMFRCTL